MRVAVVTTSYPCSEGDPSGHFVRTEVRALAAAGHAVTVFAPGQAGHEVDGRICVRRLPHRSAFGWPGAMHRLRARPFRIFGALEFAWAARKALLRHRADLVVAHWIIPNGWPIALGTTAELEIVAHGSDVRLLCRLPRALRMKIVRGLLARGVRLRFVSSELRQRLAAGGLPELYQRSVVSQSPIDISSAPTRATARRDRGLRDDERLVLCVGRLVKPKRTELALAAASLLPRARIVVVGDGPELQTLQRSFPHAEFLGLLPRSVALGWIAAADLLISASREEGAPSAIREARALGVSVVAVASGDLVEWAKTDPHLFVLDRASWSLSRL